jgi:hypothetical protein
LRDILTVLASLVILVLAAALIAPPFVDWEARRDWIDRSISTASGTGARAEGRVALRLLPSPRLQVDTLRLGGEGDAAPSLEARGVTAEIELPPLLRGEVRFREARAEEAELRVPIDPAAAWPVGLKAGPAAVRDWAIQNLGIGRLLVTTLVPATGRTDQFTAEDVTIEGQRLAGPWRVEGRSRDVPFRLVTGEMTPEGLLALKLNGGGDRVPRFDVDAQAALGPAPDPKTPRLAGTVRLGLGPPAQAPAAGIPIPVTLQTAFKTAGGRIDLDQLTLEGGEGAASLRLTGTGSLRLDDPRLALNLEGRRLDLDTILAALVAKDGWERLRTMPVPAVPVPVDLALVLSSVTLAQEELADVSARATITADRLAVERFAFTAPGTTRVQLSGEAGLAALGSFSGRASIASASSDRFGLFLDRLGLRGPTLAVLDGRPFEASADLSVAAPVTSFRNARLRLGDATLSGSGRYTAPEGTARGRLEAQLAVQGLDLAELPQVSSLFEATRHLDVGFTLDARNVRYGPGRSAGRISARILSDGPALVVETLDIADLAGASGRVSGRIAPDGSGRIAGRVTAQRAAPLVDLLSTVWIGGASRLVPPFLREGALDLALVSERPATGDRRLRTTVNGTAAGGRFEAEALTSDGATDTLTVRLSTDQAGRWIDRPGLAALRRPGTLELRSVRVGDSPFHVTVTGEVAGLRIATPRAFVLSGDETLAESGEAELATADIAPFLAILGEGAVPEGATPLQARVTLGREAGVPLLTVAGRVANEAVNARLLVRSRADISGSLGLDRLSLPWLVNAFALNPQGEPRPGQPWSASRFGAIERPAAAGQAEVRVRRLSLGRGFEAENAAFTFALNPDGVALRGFEAGFAGGRLAGALNVVRQGAQASVSGEGAVRGTTLAALGGTTPIQAGLGGTLRFGATGDSVAALVANLGGTGEVQVTGLQVANADPAGLARAITRILAEDDPLAVRRLETVMAEEFNRAAFRAPAVTAPANLVAGALRLSPFTADAGTAVWQGAASFDFRTLALDAQGTLTARGNVGGWTGNSPYVGLNWRGPLRAPVRQIDTGPLNTGLAAIVLQRELARIEAFETEGNERQRRTNRLEMDRQRERDRVAAEEAARQARLREEAERRAAEERARIEAERRAAEERARIEAERRAAEERARLEAERRAAEERARQEAARRAAEERARLEAQRRAEEQARIEAERRAAEERVRQEQARIEAERKAAEERVRQDAERRAAEERARIEAERRAAEEAARQARIEADRRAAEERARRDAERRAAEERARQEAERRAAEERARVEAERRSAEEAAQAEAERQARSRAEAERQERVRQMQRLLEETERQDAERRAAGAPSPPAAPSTLPPPIDLPPPPWVGPSRADPVARP